MPEHKPQVDALARQLADVGLPHALLVRAVKETYASLDQPSNWEQAARERARVYLRQLLGPVINATGVLLHTNLGRAPLVGAAGAAPLVAAPTAVSPSAAGTASVPPASAGVGDFSSQAADADQPIAPSAPAAGAAYVIPPTTGGVAPAQVATSSFGGAAAGTRTASRGTNLEFDLETGERGQRHGHLAFLLRELTGAEDALVVNNCAAAVTLVLGVLAGGRSVVVSRGEMVEIGGGFRIPEVISQSGARLVEVGTTNRTRAADYIAALEATGSDVSVLLKVHPSNYEISGFTQAASVAELAQLDTHLVADVGSGLLDAECPWLDGPPPAWLAGEPAVRQTLEAGAHLVTFSGDKLLGGPQAGIICGRADLVARCAAHPLMRAVRPGGLVLAELQHTLLAYLRRDVAKAGFWKMATTSVDELMERAVRLNTAVGGAHVVHTQALCGGGSLPSQVIDSVGLAVPGDCTFVLRDRDLPVIARVTRSGVPLNGTAATDGQADGVGSAGTSSAPTQQTVADLRTVDPADDNHLALALMAAVARGQRRP